MLCEKKTLYILYFISIIKNYDQHTANITIFLESDHYVKMYAKADNSNYVFMPSPT